MKHNPLKQILLDSRGAPLPPPTGINLHFLQQFPAEHRARLWETMNEPGFADRLRAAIQESVRQRAIRRRREMEEANGTL